LRPFLTKLDVKVSTEEPPVVKTDAPVENEYQKKVEEQLEAFFFVMGLLAVTISGVWSLNVVEDALLEPVKITLAVLLFGLIFHYLRIPIRHNILKVEKVLGFRIFFFVFDLLAHPPGDARPDETIDQVRRKKQREHERQNLVAQHQDESNEQNSHHHLGERRVARRSRLLKEGYFRSLTIMTDRKTRMTGST
jgi:hypothetical protein